ncbi:MAG: hypothetical protein DHS20C20_29950 [Ardenticatenaceae bacterium]|nr:MAG: hypothetical protein DHS20C20_29950 [Ardenticatenaceae bacterium]
MNLYFLMTFLFLAVAGLTALDAALTSWTIIPWVNGLRWLRVHFITLGALTELLFGLLPLLAAKRASLPKPRTRLDIWLLLNAGLMLLLAGIPTVNQVLIFTGGTLIFVATLLLSYQLYQLRPANRAALSISNQFYITGLGFFLVGIIVGTGLWLGWGEALAIHIPIEVHIHANNWGLMSLVFAGLLIEIYPKVAKRPFHWPDSPTKIYWMMSLGALGLTLGPWFNSLYFTVPGLVLHIGATVWLLLNVLMPVWNDRAQWAKPGLWHLVTAYAWLMAPVMIAPLIILKMPGFPGAGIEANAPQALIYGWVLQFGFAIIPYFARQQFQPKAEAKLGGSWLSLIGVHLGGIALWVSIFVENSGLWHGLAYGLWTIAIVPIAIEMWHILRPALEGDELETAVSSTD